ncbi:MAG: hypothetical protein ABFE07_28730 [Armatimonadia bacterium]
MYACYLIALVPLVIGAVLFIVQKKVVWFEWLISAGAGFATAGIFHAVALGMLTGDTETWSGQVTQVVDYPYWEARWTTTETYTDSKGRSHTRTVHHHEVYPEHWAAQDTLGQELDVSKPTFEDFKRRLGGTVNRQKPYKDNFDCGDPYTYHTPNTAAACIPVTAWRNFENKVKTCKNLFAFSEVPKDVPVFAYPANRDPYHSNRLLGATGVGGLEWDQLNARLGPTKKVNLILVGCGAKDVSFAQYQEAAWVRGRKNDLVLCFGGDPKKPTWSYVFGWTDREVVKRNLESILLEKGADLPAIEAEVRANYLLKDWSKFDYLTVEVPDKYYVWLIIIMLVTQALFWVWAVYNEFDKETVAGRLLRLRRGW